MDNETIRCGEPATITQTPTTPTPYQHIPISIHNVSPTHFINNEKIKIACDGGLAQGHATFGVVISINNKITTELYGSLPTQINPTSLTSESYGCYYALNKIQHQLGTNRSYQLITVLIDNKTLITRIKTLLQYNPFPTACSKSEHEVISANAHIIKSLPNIIIKHISSKRQTGTNTEEQILHSLSHHLSQDARQETSIPNIIIPKLHTEAIDLIINNQKVSSNYLEALREASAKPMLWTYYKEKYNWSDNCINKIDWKAHGIAISYLNGRKQKTTLQFIHKWLPINASHSVQASGTGKLCPYCQQCDEDHHHFLSCAHPTSQQQWKNAAQLLRQKITNYNKHIHPTLKTL
jgi:hypothetical protein